MMIIIIVIFIVMIVLIIIITIFILNVSTECVTALPLLVDGEKATKEKILRIFINITIPR